MLSKMGMNPGRGGKVNLGAMQSTLNQNMKMAQMKERALQKSAQKKAEMEAERIRVANLPEVKQLTEQELEELIFSIDGDKPEKTMRTSNNNGQKKKKKKGKKK